jgi:hypothetical protein
MLRAAGETGTKQDNIRDWLQLAEGYPALQQEEEIAPIISRVLPIAYNYLLPIYFFKR